MKKLYSFVVNGECIIILIVTDMIDQCTVEKNDTYFS